MNAIEQLEQRLHAWSDEVVSLLDAPCDVDNGYWFLNVSCWGHDVQVEWSRRHAYRIVYRGESKIGLGEVHEEFYLNGEGDRVFTRVVVTLSGRRYLHAVHA